MVRDARISVASAPCALVHGQSCRVEAEDGGNLPSMQSLNEDEVGVPGTAPESPQLASRRCMLCARDRE